MPVLRIEAVGAQVALRYEPAEGAPLAAQIPFEFRQTPQQREDIRWYLEDYVRYPHDPAPVIAARIEQHMAEQGALLFAALFGASEESRAIWQAAKPGLTKTRVEIASVDTDIPWEFLREGENATPIALTALSFVRTPPEAPSGQPAARPRPEPLRILLAICRPARGADVPFRSVAGRLIQGLRRADTPCECRVLRPPTFERLRQELFEAREDGRPYDIVHFDGHGVYLDQTAQALNQRPDPRRMRGYLVFETEDGEEQHINGALMGQVLQESETPILLLNACRSAHAEPAGQPGDSTTAGQQQPFGSLAQEVSARGLVGVVAMRFNIFVETAATFVEQLYAGLTAGGTLGEAVAAARRSLAENPIRTAGDHPRSVQDWCVPEVYEVRPWSIGARPAAETVALSILHDLPASPETGFVGRDIALIEIDRALDSHAAVLLHGLVGSGKTAAAAEFARWYSLTGGIKGPVIFVPLGQHKSFAKTLADARLQDLESVLWICDGSERLTSLEDRRDFVELIRSARQAKIKLVITSRNAERSWIAEDAAHRILLGPITVPDCADLVGLLIKARGAGIEGEALGPLIPFSFGNPMTLAGLVDQAIREGVSTPEQCRAFVERLRADGFGGQEGQALRPVAEAVTAPLAAFGEQEQIVLSLLCLFREYVNYEFFCLMGGGSAQPKPDWGLDVLSGLSFEGAKDLLERAADQGLLVRMGGVYYAIHPALCWAFQPLCARFPSDKIERAYVKTYVLFSRNFNAQLAQGNNVVLRSFGIEQPNLHRARRLAQQHGWWEDEIAIARGLMKFLEMSQRTKEFSQLALELFCLVVDPQTNVVRPGREGFFPTIMEHLATVAENDRDWNTAEILLGRAIDHNRPRLAARRLRPEDDPGEARLLVSELALELFRRGQIRYRRRDPHCLDDYLESIDLCQRAGLGNQAANAALDAGTGYLRLQSVRDLDAAEQWYLRACEWFDRRDSLGQAKCCIQLAAVAQERFAEAQTKEAALEALQSANSYSFRALSLLPEIAVQERAICHSRLGANLRYLGELAASLEHSQEAMRLYDQYGDVSLGADARLDVANLLMEQGRYEQSADYVREAIRQFKSLGGGAAASVAEAEQRLAWIEAKLREG
jgi:tetratricopeptide (TPR) repeat protein